MTDGWELYEGDLVESRYLEDRQSEPRQINAGSNLFVYDNGDVATYVPGLGFVVVE